MGNDYQEREQTTNFLSFSFLYSILQETSYFLVKWFEGRHEDADWLSDMDKG